MIRKITLCPICKQPLTPDHHHGAHEARGPLRKLASPKVRVTIPKPKTFPIRRRFVPT